MYSEFTVWNTEDTVLPHLFTFVCLRKIITLTTGSKMVIAHVPYRMASTAPSQET